MAPIAGKYEYVSNENFVEYLIAVGTPADAAAQALQHVKTVNITQDGDNITIDGRAKGNVLIVGQEVDESLPDEQVAKTSTELNGDTLTLVTKNGGKTGTRVHHFTDSGFVLTLTSDHHPVVAKLTYKRV